MKKILIAAFLALCSMPLMAQNNVVTRGGQTPISNQSTNVSSILRSSMTCSGVSISTVGANVGATDVNGSTTTARSFITVQNLDSGANLYCNENTTVATSGALGGFRITPGQTVTFTMPLWEHWYCITSATSATNAEICKGY